MNKRGMTSRVVGALLVASVILLLILIGPAQAYLATLTLSDKVPVKGDTISIKAKATVEENEKLPIEYFILSLKGPENRECKFYPNATIISGCNNMLVSLKSSPDFDSYGYGYYNPGDFIFNITFDSDNFKYGIYKSTLKTQINQETKISSEQEFTIISPLNLLSGCSIRSSDGSAIINNNQINSPKTKLNLNVPLKNAQKGDGSITIQNKNQRYSYEFEIQKASKANDGFIMFETYGKIKTNNGKTSQNLNSIIIFDTNKMKVYLRSDVLKIDDSDITFVRC